MVNAELHETQFLGSNPRGVRELMGYAHRGSLQ
jgi:hypothetical protein